MSSRAGSADEAGVTGAAGALVGEVVVVVVSCPDAPVADRIARLLVEARLAACVQVGPVIRSTYRWDGRVTQADEVVLTVKTRRARYAEVEAAIRTAHPYQVPEVLALPVTAGLPAYLRWVLDETDDDPFRIGGTSVA